MKSNPALCLCIAVPTFFLVLAPPAGAALQGSTAAPVGRSGTNRLVTPVNQIVTPFGRQVDLAGLRPQALALSPAGRLLAVSGKTSAVVLLDPATGAIRQRVALPSEKQNEPQPGVAWANILRPDAKGQASYTGRVFSQWPGGA